MYSITNVNGTTFIFSPLKDIETASLGIFVKVGSRFEKKALRGISHFLEHMLFKGSKKYSYKKIKQEIEGRGGSLNGYTSEEFTGYYAHFLNKNLQVTLNILLSMVEEPLFQKQEIEKERNVIFEEIKMYNDLPSSRVDMLLDRLLWPNHALGEDIIGDFSTVKNIKRDDLLEFKNSYYQPSNMVIAFSGNYRQDKIVRLIKSQNRKKSFLLELPLEPPPLRGLKVKTEHKKLKQTYLSLGFRGISYLSKERAVIELINVILGANMSSRLFEEIREKQALCYDISTSTAKYKDAGAFTIKLGLDKNKIKPAILTILRELKKMKNINVGAQELMRAKDYLLGQTAMGLEQPQGRMFYVAQFYLTLGKIYTFNQVKEEVTKVTPKEIRELSNRIFDFENICVASVGDLSKTGEEIIRDAIKEAAS